MANPELRPVSYEPMSDGKVKTTFSNGAALIVDPKTYALKDSGQVSAFRPALYVKPQGPISRIQRAWSAFLGKPDPRRTTEQGASSAASPVSYYLTLWEQFFGRRARIEDTRSLYLTDPRVFRSTNMYVNEALRGGPKIRIQGKTRKDKKAQEIGRAVEKIYNATLIQEWGKGLIIEGDLFIQHIVSKGELIQAKAMPAVGMQRLTDDADNFIDPDRAFEQIDSMTLETVAPFASSMMTHTRWAKVNGDRYGTSELCTARRAIRTIELMEQAVAINRMVRAPLRRLHSVGSPDNTGSPQELANYKAENGFFTGKQEAFNPKTVMMDYFGNGQTTITNLDGDPNVGQVGDLEYLQDVLMCALPTPPQFFGVALKWAKRDVLEDMQKLWVRSHGILQQAINEPVSHGFELALTQAGIDPKTIEYSIQWIRGGLETTTETVDWLATAKESQLISDKTAVEQMAQILGTTDTEEELAAIEKSNLQSHTQDVEKRTAGISMKEKMEDDAGITPRGRSKPKTSLNGVSKN